MSTFARFAPRLQEAIVARLGWTALRPVQELAGAAILEGRNAIVLAPTAGGKTEASIFPTLSLLMDRPPEGVGALYIAPIKALLNNQEERLGTYTEMVGMRRFVWHGDTSDAAKQRFRREPAELLMTTPESLEVMLISPRVPVQRLFRDLQVVIIDEIHALAGTDRGTHLLSVLERLVRLTKRDVQRVGLSATVGNPEAILAWMQGSSSRTGEVIDPPKVRARRELRVVMRDTWAELARDAAQVARGSKSLFFCQSRSLTETVAERMRGADIEVFVHHSSVSAEERRAAEERFHHGSNVCIVCTSTLELGIDVGDLDRVLQAGTPDTVSSFLQRMGRTGRRAGQVANTHFFCEDIDAVLQAIALIELAREGWVEPVTVQDRCWPVLVHQVMAMALQLGAVRAEACWAQLSRVPDFRGIREEEFGRVIDHLLAEGYLFEAGGQLSLGEQAERIFGRKNFMELYAVFSSPALYRVTTVQGTQIGSLEQAFVDRLVEEMSSFLLGGRAWTVGHINHQDRIIRVEPAPRGRQPSWGGFAPQLLSFALCQRIRRVLTGQDSYPYLHPAAAEALEARRADLGALLRRADPGAPLRRADPGAPSHRAGPAVQLEAAADGFKAWWWTFAGGRINFTLKHAIEHLTGWKVVMENVQLRIEGSGITHETLGEAVAQLSSASFWEDEKTWTALLSRLPEYRLSKFQRALPGWASREMIGAYLLDVAGTRAFLEGGPVE